MEEWRDIDGYEGYYQISNCGRVKSLPRKTKNGSCKYEKILKQCDDKEGYKILNLYKNGKRKTFRVHRLVAQEFIPNPNNLPEINHKNENVNDNTVENLEWCTCKYNHNYGTYREKRKGKKNPMARKIICTDTGKIFDTIKEASEYYKIGRTNIGECLAGRSNTAGGYKWEYYKEVM